METRKLGSTDHPIMFLMIDSTDHNTGKLGLSPTVTLSKDGAGFMSAVGGVSEVGYGWYAIAGNASDRDTLGEYIVHAEAAGADPWDRKYLIVPWDTFDPNMGLTSLDAQVSTRPTLVAMESSRKLTGGKKWPSR